MLNAFEHVPVPCTGVPVGFDGMPEGSNEAVVNSTAQDILRRLPGVTEANFRPLMNAAPTLAALAQLSLEQLEAAMGGVTAAKKLHEWLNAPCPIVS